MKMNSLKTFFLSIIKNQISFKAISKFEVKTKN